ncbi:hypothetical protein OAF85_01080 [Planctomycetota bacterium]|nr:hypothetical protein [Planctomycetota bacterium]
MSPQQLRTSQATTAWLTSIAAQALAAPVFIPGVGGTAYVLKLFVPQTGNEELFTLHVPDSPAGQARPLLVGFHSYGVSHLDFSYYNTSFLSEADARDWFVLAPIQINPLVPRTGRQARRQRLESQHGQRQEIESRSHEGIVRQRPAQRNVAV